MKKWIEKIKYWFGNEFAGGTGSMVFWLVVGTAVVVLFAALVLKLLGSEQSMLVLLWNNTASTVNASVPEVEEAGRVRWLEYIVKALVGVCGLVVTSTLIGIIGLGIETRLQEFRRGGRKIAETGHIILLGSGNAEEVINIVKEYADGKKACLLVADTLDTEEYDRIWDLRKNLPKNISLQVQNLDTGDENAMELCSLAEAAAVIIDMSNDEKVLKTVLAVSEYLKKHPGEFPLVAAGVGSEGMILPRNMLDPRILMFSNQHLAATIIGRCCLNPEIRFVMQEQFRFGGIGFFARTAGDLEGKTFGELAESGSEAIPVGLLRKERLELLPSRKAVLSEEDQLICFGYSGAWEKAGKEGPSFFVDGGKNNGQGGTVLVIGLMAALREILINLPENIRQVLLLPLDAGEKTEIPDFPETEGRRLQFVGKGFREGGITAGLLKQVDTVVLLSNGASGESADADTMVFLQKLLSIRKQEGLAFSIFTVFEDRQWKQLAGAGEEMIIFIRDDMKICLLAQAVLNPGSRAALTELLGRSRFSLRLLPATEAGLTGSWRNFTDLRKQCYSRGVIPIGCRKKEADGIRIKLGPSASEPVDLAETDSVLVVQREE